MIDAIGVAAVSSPVSKGLLTAQAFRVRGPPDIPTGRPGLPAVRATGSGDALALRRPGASLRGENGDETAHDTCSTSNETVWSRQ